jgi:hypothetical protein
MNVTHARTRATETVKDAMGHLPHLMKTTRSGAEQVVDYVPDAVARARIGAQQTATALQTLPDRTLRQLAAASVGLAAGLYLAGAPRPVTLAAITPALLIGGAIVTRPGRVADHSA